MTVEGNVRWPPQCNINDSKSPPKGFGTNLAQMRHNGNRNGKSNRHGNGKHKKPFSKKKFTRQPKTSWKNERPKKSQLEKTIDGMPVYSRIVDGRKYWWCEKCGPKGRWTNSHHTGQHDPNFSFNKKADNKKAKFQGQANLGEGLTP